MTNGEKLKQVFPNYRIDMGELYVYVWLPNHDAVDIPHEWWDAEYKEPTTKNDLGVDLISRADLYNRIKTIDHDEDYECDEYGGNRITYHTCDWDEVLREIEDAPSVTPQEPLKQMVEIDLYSVIKQKYIEREVLDEIRAEIKALTSNRGFLSCSVDSIHEEIDAVFDKYKTESEKT